MEHPGQAVLRDLLMQYGNGVEDSIVMMHKARAVIIRRKVLAEAEDYSYIDAQQHQNIFTRCCTVQCVAFSGR